MLWNPAFIGVSGTQPAVSNAMPTIASPVWAFDTSVSSTFYTDTSATTQASANNAQVARINNALGGASYFQQATAADRPVWILNALGTKPGLRFDGTKVMSMTGVTNPGTLFQSKTFTIAMCVRISGRPSWAAHFSAGNATGGANTAGYDNLLIEANSNGWPRLYRNGGSDSGSAVPANAVYSADNQIWKTVCRSDPTNGMEIRTKSASGNFTGTGPLPTSADSFTWDVAYLGGEPGINGSAGPDYRFQGDWFEFRFWNTRASDAVFSQLQGYLDLKFGG